ncbi:MAG: DUF2141 domain-containing protein [Parvularculaceae bacterium]
MKAPFLTVALMLATPAMALAADVSIEIAGVKSASGPLYVSLQTEGQFMQNVGTAGKIVQNPGVGTVSVLVPGVAPGEYSVSVWHDIDGDAEFDRAADGRPLDGWSMLNAGALRGAPTFNAVKFSVGNSGAAIKLDMVYAE